MLAPWTFLPDVPEQVEHLAIDGLFVNVSIRRGRDLLCDAADADSGRRVAVAQRRQVRQLLKKGGGRR